LLTKLRFDDGTRTAVFPDAIRDDDEPQFRLLFFLAFRPEKALGVHAHGAVNTLMGLIEVK
jgi:hypothetical protein